MKTTRSFVRPLAAIALCLAGFVAGCSSGTPPASTAQSSTTAAAQPTAAGSLPKLVDANGKDLQGDWVSTERQYYSKDAKGTGKETITITDQDGAMFRVLRDVELDIAVDFGNGGPPSKKVVDEPALGVINVDGSISIVKQGDGGTLNGWLTDANTMVLSYTEAGVEPGVARVTLVRNPSATTSGTTPGSTPGTTVGTTKGSTPGTTTKK